LPHATNSSGWRSDRRGSPPRMQRCRRTNGAHADGPGWLTTSESAGARAVASLYGPQRTTAKCATTLPRVRSRRRSTGCFCTSTPALIPAPSRRRISS
jgi:hypothetical protein